MNVQSNNFLKQLMTLVRHITDYFQVLNDIDNLLQTNSKLPDLVQQYSNNQSTSVVNNNAPFTPILRQLILNAEKNVESLPNYRQHPEILKKFVDLCWTTFISIYTQ